MSVYLRTCAGISLAIFYAGSAQAVVAPYYAHGDFFTRTGSPLYEVIDEGTQAGTGALTQEGGARWWCETPNCGVSISPGASTAWAEVSVDPVAGTLGARAGSMGYAAYAGYGRAYGYISQVFRVGTDGTLQPGDSVSVDANMSLEGIIDSQTTWGGAAAMVLLNHYDPSQAYVDFLGNPVDYMPVSTFQDIFYWDEYLAQMLGVVQYAGGAASSPVVYTGSASANVSVGDILIMETMLYVDNDRGLAAGLESSWTDFRNTLSATLTTATAGATLTAVPVPAAAWLFGSGLLGLIGWARRKAA